MFSAYIAKSPGHHWGRCPRSWGSRSCPTLTDCSLRSFIQDGRICCKSGRRGKGAGSLSPLLESKVNHGAGVLLRQKDRNPVLCSVTLLPPFVTLGSCKGALHAVTRIKPQCYHCPQQRLAFHPMKQGPDSCHIVLCDILESSWVRYGGGLRINPRGEGIAHVVERMLSTLEVPGSVPAPPRSKNQ